MNNFKNRDNKLINSYEFARNADIVFSEVVSNNEFSKLNLENFTVVFTQNSTILYKINNFTLRENAVIFTSIVLIEELFKLLNQIKDFKNIKIVCTQGDDEFSNILLEKKPNCVSKIYSTNVSAKNEKLIPIPIGLSNNYSPKNLLAKDFTNLNNTDYFKSKENFLYVNFQENTNSVKRENIYNIFEDKQWAKVDQPNLGLNDYKKNLENSAFVLCPWGNGFDTHRIWESLYSGSIPIIENHLTYQYLDSLPVVFIENFVDLDERYLYDSIKNLSQSEFNFEKLYMNYWINKIRQDEILGETGYIVKQSVFSNYLFIFGFKLKQKLLSTTKKINFRYKQIKKFSKQN